MRRIEAHRTEPGRPASWNRIPLLVTLPLLAAGCVSAHMERFTADPRMACPGDLVRIELLAEKFTAGEITAQTASAPEHRIVDIAGSELLFAAAANRTVCEDTVFRGRVWRGAAPDCSGDDPPCGEAFVSVLTEPASFELTGGACDGDIPGTAQLSFWPADLSAHWPVPIHSERLLVGAVRNCSPRRVTVTVAGRPPVVLDAGAATDDLAGPIGLASWTVRQTLLPFEGCPIAGSTSPVPQPTPPPPLCLEIALSCPDPGEECA